MEAVRTLWFVSERLGADPKVRSPHSFPFPRLSLTDIRYPRLSYQSLPKYHLTQLVESFAGGSTDSGTALQNKYGNDTIAGYLPNLLK